jgi:hypothetical protein
VPIGGCSGESERGCGDEMFTAALVGCGKGERVCAEATSSS